MEDDARELFAQALDQAEDLVAGVRGCPHGGGGTCPQAAAQAAAGQLLGLLRRVTELAGAGALPGAGAPGPPPGPGPDPSPDPGSGQGLSPDPGPWAGSWQRARRDYAQAWADPAVLDRPLHTAGGVRPGRAVLVLHVPLLVLFSGDLARAAGRVRDLDERLGRFALDLALRTVPARPRPQEGPFRPAVPVPGDAPVHLRLAAWLGREVPGTWPGPSPDR